MIEESDHDQGLKIEDHQKKKEEFERELEKQRWNVVKVLCYGVLSKATIQALQKFH